MFTLYVFLSLDNDPKYISLPGSYLCASELVASLHLVKTHKKHIKHRHIKKCGGLTKKNLVLAGTDMFQRVDDNNYLKLNKKTEEIHTSRYSCHPDDMCTLQGHWAGTVSHSHCE